MRSFALLPVVFLLSFIDLSAGWVFTDINYAKLARDMDMEAENNDLELTDEELKQSRFSLIYPTTKWCGAGNIAESYDDLGTSVEADKCCRQHDTCPDVMLAGETKYNLTNDAFYSRLSCDCDEEFRQCLHKANTKVANQIGAMYFNALGQQCYKNDYPIKSCKRKGGWLNRKCLEYELDQNGVQIYQWFYVPNYS